MALVGLDLLSVKIINMNFQHNPIFDISKTNAVQVVADAGTATSYSTTTTSIINDRDTVVYCVTIIKDISLFTGVTLSDPQGSILTVSAVGTGATFTGKLTNIIFVKNYSSSGLAVGSTITVNSTTTNGSGLGWVAITACVLRGPAIIANHQTVSAQNLLANTAYGVGNLSWNSGTVVRGDYKKSTATILFSASNAAQFINGLSPLTGVRQFVNSGNAAVSQSIFGWQSPLTPLGTVGYAASWNVFTGAVLLTILRLTI